MTSSLDTFARRSRPNDDASALNSYVGDGVGKRHSQEAKSRGIEDHAERQRRQALLTDGDASHIEPELASRPRLELRVCPHLQPDGVRRPSRWYKLGGCSER